MERATRILVAEDNAATNRVVCHVLNKAGYEVTGAKCGRTAWDWLNRQPFDLVVCDLKMPGMSGTELCQRMRQDSRLASLPVIVLTAKGFELDEACYRDTLGVSVILFKPFSPRELVRTLAALLQSESAASGTTQ